MTDRLYLYVRLRVVYRLRHDYDGIIDGAHRCGLPVIGPDATPINYNDTHRIPWPIRRERYFRARNPRTPPATAERGTSWDVVRLAFCPA